MTIVKILAFTIALFTALVSGAVSTAESSCFRLEKVLAEDYSKVVLEISPKN